MSEDPAQAYVREESGYADDETPSYGGELAEERVVAPLPQRSFADLQDEADNQDEEEGADGEAEEDGEEGAEGDDDEDEDDVSWIQSRSTT